MWPFHDHVVARYVLEAYNGLIQRCSDVATLIIHGLDLTRQARGMRLVEEFVRYTVVILTFSELLHASVSDSWFTESDQ